MVAVKHLTKKFKGKEILFHINEYIFNDGIYEIKGKSGSGKTTFLKILAGLEEQSGGSVETNNDNSIFLPNEGLLINNLSFNENIKFYSSLIKDRKFYEDFLSDLINKFSLQNLLDKKVKNLSGGEKKILNIIFALTTNNKIILLDEPFAELDEERKLILIETLNAIQNKIIIFSNNDSDILKLNVIDSINISNFKENKASTDLFKFVEKRCKTSIFSLCKGLLRENKWYYVVSSIALLIIFVISSIVGLLDIKSKSEVNDFALMNDVTQYQDVSFSRHDKEQYVFDNNKGPISTENINSLFETITSEDVDFMYFLNFDKLMSPIKYKNPYNFKFVILSKIKDNKIYLNFDEFASDELNIISSLGGNVCENTKINLMANEYFSNSISTRLKDEKQVVFIGDEFLKSLILGGFFEKFLEINKPFFCGIEDLKIKTIKFVAESDIVSFYQKENNSLIQTGPYNFINNSNLATSEEEVVMSWYMLFSLSSITSDFSSVLSINKNDIYKVNNIVVFESPLERYNIHIDFYQNLYIVLIAVDAVLIIAFILWMYVLNYRIFKKQSIFYKLRCYNVSKSSILHSKLINIFITILIPLVIAILSNFVVTRCLSSDMMNRIFLYDGFLYPFASPYDQIKYINYFDLTLFGWLNPIILAVGIFLIVGSVHFLGIKHDND